MASAPSSSQTTEQFDRLETLARYTITASVCVTLGMKIVPNAGEKIEADMRAHLTSWGMQPQAYEQASKAAANRQLRIFKIDNDATLAKAQSEKELRNFRSFFMRHGPTCIRAATDPLFGKILAAPSGFNLETAATEAADKLLAGGGLASWQTPLIQARGDLMMAAGACRRHIGPARSDAVFDTYARATDARERDHYIKSYDEGLADTELNLDAKQCERLLKRLAVQAE